MAKIRVQIVRFFSRIPIEKVKAGLVVVAIFAITAFAMSVIMMDYCSSLDRSDKELDPPAHERCMKTCVAQDMSVQGVEFTYRGHYKNILQCTCFAKGDVFVINSLVK